MSLKVVVKVIDLKTGQVTISRCIALNTEAGLSWLRRVTTFAVNHQRGVQIFNVTDEALADHEQPNP